MVKRRENPTYQYGYGLDVFKGPVLQRGYGLGGFFKGLSRTFAPVVKRGLVSAGKKALETGVEVLGDVVRGKNVKQAIRSRVKENAKELFQSAIKDVTQGKTFSSTRKPARVKTSRKRTNLSPAGTSRRKKQKPDIFT